NYYHSVISILCIKEQRGEQNYKNRQIKADTFPKGIDYEKYHAAASSKEVKDEKKKLHATLNDFKLILSLDRQDYSKGIMNRLEGYELFLENNPDWRQKVCMVMVVIPSRTGVENYQDIKRKLNNMAEKLKGNT